MKYLIYNKFVFIIFYLLIIYIMEETKEEIKIEETKEEIIDKFSPEYRIKNMDKECEIFNYTLQRLNLDPDSKIYDYNNSTEMLRDYLLGINNIMDLITPEDIFDLFLIKFKTLILGIKNEN